jgi:DNA invertase Pin-like site-specific DNA recombinase
LSFALAAELDREAAFTVEFPATTTVNLDGRLHAVVVTLRKGDLRVISFRKPNRKQSCMRRMIGDLAELERSLVSAGTRAGVKAAQRRGVISPTTLNGIGKVSDPRASQPENLSRD